MEQIAGCVENSLLYLCEGEVGTHRLRIEVVLRAAHQFRDITRLVVRYFLRSWVSLLFFRE